MSEKRFKFEKECTENFFTEKGVFYNNERPMSVNEIITLLNSLYNENEQLKKADKLNEKFATEMIERLQKENEQLRLELETHKHPLWSTREAERKLSEVTTNLADEVKKNGLLNEEINQLRIENMRLKKNKNNEKCKMN